MAFPARVIGFDADDTLWHNENIFAETHARFRALLARYHDADTVERTLFATEMRNLQLYGYGIKSFTLCAVETAIELTRGEIKAQEIDAILKLGREMLSHPVDLLPGVAETLAALHSRFTLLLITKGDLRDQERKVRNSGLADRFQWVEIVSEKDITTYQRILARHGISPEEFLMVGNSLKSDIVPVLELGGMAVHVPYPLTWAHEKVEHAPEEGDRFRSVSNLKELLTLLEKR